MSVYRVVGPRCYRGHRPGDLFEATLETRAEARAIGRGDIQIVERSTPTVQQYTFPAGWLTQKGAAAIPMSKTTYKVMAGTFQGHPEGEEFEADLDEALERRAKERGQIRVVKRGDEKETMKGKGEAAE